MTEQYKKTTVVFPIKGSQIVLGMKKRGFGAEWWNGYGGKLEPGESYAASAVRETEEESGLVFSETNLVHAANLVFRFDGNVNVITRAYIASDFEGEPMETDEMRPEWFALDSIPYDTMWPGDDKWIPKILGEKALLPLGFVLDFTGDNQFIAIEQADPQSLEGYF